LQLRNPLLRRKGVNKPTLNTDKRYIRLVLKYVNDIIPSLRSERVVSTELKMVRKEQFNV
jgi:hypothetical protein